MPRRITLQVLADELGCSAKTVSNAFNRPDQLSAATREKILATAARRGYAGPNPLAAGLRRGRVGALGFAYANSLAYAFEDPVSVALLAGISSVAEGAGAGLLLVPGSATPERSSAAINRAVIDGLVVSSLADDDPVLEAALARRLPTVVIDQPRPDRLARVAGENVVPSWIGVEDRVAASLVAEHVISLGHRRLGVVSFGLHRRPIRGLADQRAQAAATYAVTRDRLAGYRDAAVRAGLDWRAVPVAAGTDSTVVEGAVGAALLLDQTPRPTAIICLSDRLAEGALQTARSHGLAVPQDVSIVGFDDAEPAARLGLTTIRQPSRTKGELAARTLIGLIAGAGGERARLLPTDLVLRSSTAPPPADA